MGARVAIRGISDGLARQAVHPRGVCLRQRRGRRRLAIVDLPLIRTPLVDRSDDRPEVQERVRFPLQHGHRHDRESLLQLDRPHLHARPTLCPAKHDVIGCGRNGFLQRHSLAVPQQIDLHQMRGGAEELPPFALVFPSIVMPQALVAR